MTCRMIWIKWSHKSPFPWPKPCHIFLFFSSCSSSSPVIFHQRHSFKEKLTTRVVSPGYKQKLIDQLGRCLPQQRVQRVHYTIPQGHDRGSNWQTNLSWENRPSWLGLRPVALPSKGWWVANAEKSLEPTLTRDLRNSQLRQRQTAGLISSQGKSIFWRDIWDSLKAQRTCEMKDFRPPSLPPLPTITPHPSISSCVRHVSNICLLSLATLFQPPKNYIMIKTKPILEPLSTVCYRISFYQIYI